MRRSAVVRVRLLVLSLLALLAFAALAGAAGGVPPNGPSANLVISQIYGGGGNSGATFTHDYIEIFNRGTTSVSLDGRSLQYTSAAGSANLGSAADLRTELPDVSIPAGGYFLVREGQGAGGTTPVPADFIDSTPIAMSATAGRVALAEGTDSLACNTAATCSANGNDARIIDLVGYGTTAAYFEGTEPAPAPSNTTADLRGVGGCQETDNNATDFGTAAPSPRNSLTALNPCPTGTDTAPSVDSTTPANGAIQVATTADITINFSEPVSTAAGWYTITCTTSGAHTATQSGGPESYTLNPDTDFVAGESCTVTIDATKVTDTDVDDPPNQMAANHTFTFHTTMGVTQIGTVQGAAHFSPFLNQVVVVEGVVTAERGSNTWIQDPTPDGNPATSEALLVFGSAVSNAVAVGDLVQVRGTVTEFRPGCAPSCAPTSSAFNNLTITELAAPGLGVAKLGTAALPANTVIGSGGRVPPTRVIDNDATTGNVETSNAFDPAQDGIDFYETLENMLVQVNDAVVVGPRNNFGEILVLGDDGARADRRTNRGGIVVRDLNSDPPGDYRSGDFNPERIMLDDLFLPVPPVDVADHFASAVGLMTYDFANYKIVVTQPLTELDGALPREVARDARSRELAVATYNVENLDPGDATFAEHAGLIVNNLRSPDVIAIEEIQDNDGAANTAVTDASGTWAALIAAIQAAGGPTYQFRQIDPVDDQDGGEPGGNIRVGFLFRTDRGLSFVDRPGATSTTPNGVAGSGSSTRLTFSPGRVDPNNPAFTDSRKPLAGEFRWRGETLFLIAHHFNSKGGDQPLYGRFQPPARVTETQRHAQAAVVNDFVDTILDANRRANVVVLGDINDFEFSQTVDILTGRVMTSLFETLPNRERYSYVFEGNSQVLDQILVTDRMLREFRVAYDSVHVNSEYADQTSDHDPQLAFFRDGGDDDDDDDGGDDDD